MVNRFAPHTRRCEFARQLVGLLLFAADALFVGLVIPGKGGGASVLGGVMASRGRVHAGSGLNVPATR